MTGSRNNKHVQTRILVLVLCVVSLFPIAAQEVPLPRNPLDGQKVFTEKGCVRCHSIMGKGGKVGSDLAKLRSIRSPVGVVAMMWNHVSDMSKAMEAGQMIPRLEERELGDLVAYLFSISYFDEPGDAERGRVVFQRTGCVSCHQLGGAGGTIGPSLDKVKGFRSALLLAQEMWNHGVGMSQTMERLGIKRPIFEGSELADLLRYMRSMSRTQEDDKIFLVPGSPQNGQRLFQSKGCMNCHKIGGTGKAVGPDLTKKQLHRGATVIAGTMWNHGFMMWQRMKAMKIPVPKFEGNEMADIISYLYFLQFQQQTGNVARGKALADTKGCTNCHTIGGLGDSAGKELAHSQQFHNLLSIAAKMWNHNLEMQARMREANIPFPRFSEQEMTDLLAYIRSHPRRKK